MLKEIPPTPSSPGHRSFHSCQRLVIDKRHQRGTDVQLSRRSKRLKDVCETRPLTPGHEDMSHKTRAYIGNIKVYVAIRLRFLTGRVDCRPVGCRDAHRPGSQTHAVCSDGRGSFDSGGFVQRFSALRRRSEPSSGSDD